MRKSVLIAAVLVAAVAVGGATGCRRVPLEQTPSGASRAVSTETTQVARAGAENLKADVQMGVGELAISAAETGSANVVDATFKYAPARWKPEVDYSVEGSVGALSVRQPDTGGTPGFGARENAWDLKFDPTIPSTLALKLGVGESTIDLSRVKLAGLDVTTGVGKTTIDLSGTPTADLYPRIYCGVGEVDLTIPSQVPVRIIGGNEGIGDLHADGLTKDGRDLVNDAWVSNAAGPKLEITINRGVGDVTITSAD